MKTLIVLSPTASCPEDMREDLTGFSIDLDNNINSGADVITLIIPLEHIDIRVYKIPAGDGDPVEIKVCDGENLEIVKQPEP